MGSCTPFRNMWVMGMTCDGVAANRKLFRLHNPDAKPGDIVHEPCADDGRDFYFLLIHLI